MSRRRPFCPRLLSYRIALPRAIGKSRSRALMMHPAANTALRPTATPDPFSSDYRGHAAQRHRAADRQPPSVLGLVGPRFPTRGATSAAPAETLTGGPRAVVFRQPQVEAPLAVECSTDRSWAVERSTAAGNGCTAPSDAPQLGQSSKTNRGTAGGVFFLAAVRRMQAGKSAVLKYRCQQTFWQLLPKHFFAIASGLECRGPSFAARGRRGAARPTAHAHWRHHAYCCQFQHALPQLPIVLAARILRDAGFHAARRYLGFTRGSLPAPPHAI